MTDSPNLACCSLNDDEAERQLLEWADLQKKARRTEAIPGGVSMHIPGGLEAQLSDLVARESACCSFLNIEISPGAGSDLKLTITTEDEAARPVIMALSGLRAT